MFKLIIADDEKITRDGLEQYIPWKDYGITTVLTAKNGLVALELAKQVEPDIVVTDVRMPKMDGIQFAMQLRELYPECKIIFLSGYSDKEYLKSAIHLKAINYIEKPINFSEITQVVRDTVTLCEDERKKKRETLPFLKQEIALELIQENIFVDSLLNKYDDPLLRGIEEHFHTAACIRLNWKPGLEPEEAGVLKREISYLFCNGSVWGSEILAGGFIDNERFVLIWASPDADSLPDMALAQLQEISRGAFTVSIGVGCTVRGWRSIPVSFREANDAVSRQFYRGTGKVYRQEPCSQSPFHRTSFELDSKQYSLFREYLKKADRNAAFGFLGELSGRIRNAENRNIDYIKNIYFDLLLLVFEAARELGLIETVEKNEKRYLWQEIEGTRTLAELSDYMYSNIGGVFDSLGGKDAVNRTAYQVMKYVREHYANRELSIQKIADHAYLSRTYLCSFFKKSTGKTVNEFITEVRIEKAMELLKDSRSKLYEISSDVGFCDVNYFSTLFKKSVGCTPSEYREKFRL